MSPEANAILQEIVAVARDGKEFYEYAAMVTRDPVLKERFSRLAQSKSDVVALVGSRALVNAEPDPSRREFRAGVRATLTRLRSLLSLEDASNMLGELEHLEDYLIYHFSWVLTGSTDEGTRRQLANLLPVLKQCQTELAGAGQTGAPPQRGQHRQQQAH